MINLFVSYFKTSDATRQSEIDACLKKNTANDFINRIFILCEQAIPDNELPILLGENRIKVFIRSRPTYNTIFELVNEYSENEDHNIIANSDIYFDETIANAMAYGQNDCLALCRWECETGKFLNRRDSQDTWIFKGKIKPNIQGDFCMGTPGCDNAIANRLEKAGYNVISPSKTIKSWHLHTSKERTYNSNRVTIPQPYKFMERYT